MIKDMKEQQCLLLLQNNYLGHLAYIGHNSPYILPITYYYDPEKHCIISISGEGHKIESVREQPLVSLNVSNILSLNNWQSVLIHGEYEELKGIDAKYQLHHFLQGVKRISEIKEKLNLQFVGDFSSKITSDETTLVFRIKIVDITGKQRTPS
ncbi:hypothetical protein KCTC52924_00598 [Arenibacter antarcticus]|uniref:Pyridoxamine 5'-phosphate oxidase family protein n=1 Tax=Arenibacter antarcticus TaxID=2040469 RepID=A0ABW5VBS5_9FLAO|nr:pyridoxamine 5'-phosphate oxidase family protein [Arenibacter sp. H213]MCM4169336.1 flavin mononucleotide-binding protein [Arenibacter sp. H213]